MEHVNTIDNMGFIGSDTVDLIYTCHVLEHLRRKDAGRVLKEWLRVLKPGGVMRVSVPDFARLSDLCQKYGDINMVIGPIFGRQDYLHTIHYNVLDEKSLGELLLACGFESP